MFSTTVNPAPTVKSPATEKLPVALISTKLLTPELVISPYILCEFGILISPLTFNSSDPRVILP